MNMTKETKWTKDPMHLFSFFVSLRGKALLDVETDKIKFIRQKMPNMIKTGIFNHDTVTRLCLLIALRILSRIMYLVIYLLLDFGNRKCLLNGQ